MTELAVTARPLPVIEAELDLLERDTVQKETALIENYIEVGRRLEEVKAQLDHGQWGPWLEKRGYPQPKAIKLMKVFRAYGKDQQSLFGGEAKSKAFSNLGFHKLVQLLAIEDEEEREDFVAEHDVENMSTRELERALRERDEARRQAETSAAEARTAEEARAKMEGDMKTVKASLKDQKALVRRMQTEADSLRTEAVSLRTELKELKNRPVEVAVETREPTAEELERLTAQAVEEARATDRERIAGMEKQLAAADGDISAIMVHFNAWQDHYNQMMECVEALRNKNHEKVGNILNAVRTTAEGMGKV